jgi:hypothetical protein
MDVKVIIRISASGFAVTSEAFGFIGVFLFHDSGGWLLILLGAAAFFAGLYFTRD